MRLVYIAREELGENATTSALSPDGRHFAIGEWEAGEPINFNLTVRLPPDEATDRKHCFYLGVPRPSVPGTYLPQSLPSLCWFDDVNLLVVSADAIICVNVKHTAAYLVVHLDASNNFGAWITVGCTFSTDRRTVCLCQKQYATGRQQFRLLRLRLDGVVKFDSQLARVEYATGNTLQRSMVLADSGDLYELLPFRAPPTTPAKRGKFALRYSPLHPSHRTATIETPVAYRDVQQHASEVVCQSERTCKLFQFGHQDVTVTDVALPFFLREFRSAAVLSYVSNGQVVQYANVARHNSYASYNRWGLVSLRRDDQSEIEFQMPLGGQENDDCYIRRLELSRDGSLLVADLKHYRVYFDVVPSPEADAFREALRTERVPGTFAYLDRGADSSYARLAHRLVRDEILVYCDWLADHDYLAARTAYLRLLRGDFL